MIGFALQRGSFELRFALNLPIEGLPPERDRAILRRVILNREGFLRYLLLLLGDLGDEGAGAGHDDGESGAWGTWGSGEGSTLLEEMVRAFSREPDRLDAVKRLVENLSAEGDGEPVVPVEFLQVWDVFQAAMKERP